MLDLVNKDLPSGGQKWEEIKNAYNAKTGEYRTMESLRTKWNSLVNAKKQTGSGGPSQLTIRARNILSKINQKNYSMSMGSTTFEESYNAGTEVDEDGNQYVEEDFNLDGYEEDYLIKF